MSRTIKAAFAALVLAAAIAPAALADTPVPQASFKVSYGDLDMTNAAHGKLLLRRIEAAARRSCAIVTVRSPIKPRNVAECSRETVATAVHGLNIETLTLAWSGKNTAMIFASR